MATDQADNMPKPGDFQSSQINDWCPGCGDHGILRSLENALAELGRSPEDVAVFGGIGCSGKTPYYLNSYGVHTLHGRLLPFAAGAKLANPDLTVIAVGGDGDGLSIGAGHFVNAGRRNLDMTYILFNNGVYGLTKGQASPTLKQGEQTRSMPRSNIQTDVNPVLLALSVGFTWVGRGYAYDVNSLTRLVVQAVRHPGIACLDVLQPCPVYNDLHTKSWYRERIYSLQDEGLDPVIADAGDEEGNRKKRQESLIRAQEWGDRIPVGVFLQDLTQPLFLDQLARRQPRYSSSPPASRPVADDAGRPLVEMGPLFAELEV
ncbi:MAG: thiamine pyrophosphate-dependent enzyme [Gammaproteobacteria bacterium]|jgi:2-oxoglutarate/2-oxoacid ferredoxin oxidoreductase subunit beta